MLTCTFHSTPFTELERSKRTTIRVLSPELQECMDRTKGALLRAHTAEAKGRRKPQNPQSFGLRAGGELAQQSGVNNQQKAAARSPRLARESWRPSSAPRDRSLAHRSLRTLRSSTLKNKPTDHPNSHLEDIPSVEYGARGPGQ